MMKKRLKLLCLVVSVITGGWLALYGILTVLAKHASNAVLSQSEAASIGIIGGADGPTAMMITTTAGPDWDLILTGGLFAISLAGYSLLRNRKTK